MEDNTQKKSITEQITVAVKNGELKMRPKWYFVLKAALWIVGASVALFALLYLASLVMFILRKTGILIAPLFGWHGVFVFLTSLPWMLVLLVLFFIIILEILVRHYSFAYRAPLLYSVLAILLVVVIAGMIIDRTPLHRVLSDCPSAGGPRGGGFHPITNVPCAMGFYRDLGPRRFGSIHDGVITRIVNPDFVIINRQQEELVIVITPQTKIPSGSYFTVGDTVVVVGDRRGDRVEAFGVSFLEDWERQNQR